MPARWRTMLTDPLLPRSPHQVKQPLISRPAGDRRLSWPELTVGWRSAVTDLWIRAYLRYFSSRVCRVHPVTVVSNTDKKIYIQLAILPWKVLATLFQVFWHYLYCHANIITLYIGNVSLAKQTECLFPPTYFRQIIAFISNLESLLKVMSNYAVLSQFCFSWRYTRWSSSVDSGTVAACPACGSTSRARSEATWPHQFCSARTTLAANQWTSRRI